MKAREQPDKLRGSDRIRPRLCFLLPFVLSAYVVAQFNAATKLGLLTSSQQHDPIAASERQEHQERGASYKDVKNASAAPNHAGVPDSIDNNNDVVVNNDDIDAILLARLRNETQTISNQYRATTTVQPVQHSRHTLKTTAEPTAHRQNRLGNTTNVNLKQPISHQQQQCPIPENRTKMDANWLQFIEKNGWLPANTSGIPPEGAFYDEWLPAMDCPSALETLRWKGGGYGNYGKDNAGELSCPPGAPMWTFVEKQTSPVLSLKESKRVVCPDSGTFFLERGQGVLCKNSIRLRPPRNEAAILRAQGLMKRRPEQLQQRQQKPQPSPNNNNRQPPHIILYMQDAVSRPALYRNLKATARTIQEIADNGRDSGTHRLYEFQRHHSMGQSSINNLTPMLTGLEYDDMTAHENKYEAWAFEEFRRMGYVTINTSNSCRLSNATHGNGFNRHGPEHYFPYEMQDIGWFHSVFCSESRRHPRIPTTEVEDKCARTSRDTSEDCLSSKVKADSIGYSCVGGRSRSSLLMEHYLQIREDLREDGVPTFAFVHDYDLHVENPMELHRYDEDKAAMLKMLETSGVLKDTVVIYISDHGNQQKITLTEEGSHEYALPFWYMMVPEQVLEQLGEGAQTALEDNQRVLTSQPDVHETMLDLAGGRGMGDESWWEKHGHDPKLLGNSVLQAMPYNRNCEDAGIPEWACICGEIKLQSHGPNTKSWKDVEQKALPKVLKHMNAELDKFNLISSNVCRRLEGKSLLSVSSRPSGGKLTQYKFQFLVQSPRAEPMEFLAIAHIGIMENRGVYMNSVIQVSRFKHWTEQCNQNVTDMGGNHHFCDCVKPPHSVHGWKFNRTIHKLDSK